MNDLIKAIEMATISSAGIQAGYNAFYANGIPKACSIIRIINASNKDITISYDGVTSHDYLIAGGTLQISFQTNSQPNNKRSILAKGSPVSISGVAGAGNVYLAGYYQE